MNNRSLYRAVTVLLIVSTLTCNLVMVTFLHRFFYGDLRVTEPATLHRVASSLGTHGNLGYPDYRDVVESTDAFDELGAAMIRRGRPVYLDGQVQWVDLGWATGSFDKVIGTDSLVGGRFFDRRDDSPAAAKVAVVNETTWDRIRPGAGFEAGEQIIVKGTAFEIVGVTRNEYPYLDSMEDVEVWIPARQNPDEWQYETDDYQEYQVLARLDPAKKVIAEHQLDIALEDIEQRLGFIYTADVLSETEFRVKRNPGMHRLFVALLVVTGFLFVLGAVNQLLMLVTRSVAIASDLKIMIALGARAKHVLLRFLQGFSVLMLIALIGVAVCSAAILQIYNGMWGAQFGVIEVSKLLAPVPLLTLTVLTSLLVMLHLGFPTLMYLMRGDSLIVRDRAAGSRFSVKSVLSVSGVVLQIALVTFTILGSGAFLQSLSREGSVQVGPYDDRLVAIELALASKESAYAAQFRSRLDTIKAGLMELGGIEEMGTSSALPLHQGGWTRALIEGEPLEKEPEWIAFDLVTPGYFETMGIDLLEGRNFTEDDATRWPPEGYIVNRAYAEKHFGGQQALGRKIAPWDGVGYSPIIGIVEDAAVSTSGNIRPCIYIPSYQNRFILNIRLSDPSLTPTHPNLIAQRITATDPEAIVVNVDTIETVWKEALAAPRLGLYILVSLSSVGLILSLSGAFGYQTYMMMLREREFAIRHALGQTVKKIYWGEVRRGVIMSVVGLVFGAAAFYAGLRVFGAYFFNINLSPYGAAVVGIVLATAFLAVVSAASLASSRPKLSILMRE